MFNFNVFRILKTQNLKKKYINRKENEKHKKPNS